MALGLLNACFPLRDNIDRTENISLQQVQLARKHSRGILCLREVVQCDKRVHQSGTYPFLDI